MNEIKVVTITMKEEELKKLILEAVSKVSEKEEMLTTQQVCDLLHIDRGTVYDWKNSGKLKAYGMGKRVWYKRSEVIGALIPINKVA